MKYIIYKTTNLINNKIYIGYHSTNNIHDNYLGSGKLLKKAINKYGKDSFIREILFEYGDRELALKKEKELVSEDFIKRKDTYNLKKGGEGGWYHINFGNSRKPKWTKERRKMHSDYLKSEEGKKVFYNFFNTNSKGFSEKKHKDISKEKMSKNNINKLSKNIIEARTNDYNNIEKKYGYISKLANKWNISHTQVRRFINKFIT